MATGGGKIRQWPALLSFYALIHVTVPDCVPIRFGSPVVVHGCNDLCLLLLTKRRLFKAPWVSLILSVSALDLVLS
jgi:hypothetical protein